MATSAVVVATKQGHQCYVSYRGATPPCLTTATEVNLEFSFIRPCILLFDSISAQQRIGNLHIIRKWVFFLTAQFYDRILSPHLWGSSFSYLQAEWDVRRSERDGPTFFNKDTIRGFSPRVPGQSNLVDCGIFLLHYVEMFFKVCMTPFLS